MQFTFNNISITKPPADKSWGVNQIDDGKAPLRGDNYTASGISGRTYVSKLRDQKKITLYMWAKNEDKLNYLMDTVFIDGAQPIKYVVGSKTYNWYGEVSDFRHSLAVKEIIKIVVEITIPKP
jgi:hypothetical protein